MQFCADTMARKNDKELETTCSATVGPTGVMPGRGDQRSPESSLQSKEGILRPFGLLGGAGRGSSQVTVGRPGGRWNGVDDLCPFLKEFIKLCQISMLGVEREMAFALAQRQENQRCSDWTLPSLVTPSSEPSPFWNVQKKNKSRNKIARGTIW